MDNGACDSGRSAQWPAEVYPGQFDPLPDPMHIAIPREEIVQAMIEQGEETTMDRVCMAVVVILDALGLEGEC
mgnify:CR=1 FL=1